MLEKVRKPSKTKSAYKIIGWFLLGIICLAFAFIGLTPDTGGNITGGGAAAIVNDTSIPIRSFQEAVERETRQLGAGFNDLPAAQRRSFEKSIRERTLNSLVATEVLYQEASDHGFYAPDLVVRDELIRLPYFQEDGRFSRQRYLALLEQNRLNPAEFEADIRKQVTIEEVRDGFTRALKKPDMMRQMEAEAREAKLNIEFIAFAQSDLDMGALTSKSALQSFVEKNPQEIKEYYDSNPSEFELEKQVRARHILVKTEGVEPEKALEKIQEIQKTLTVENFAEVAEKESQDLGSKSKGGDLGFFGKGRMVPEFEKVAMSLGVGQISEPVRTSFGYHLILVDEVKGGGLRPLNEVQTEIAKKVIEKNGRNSAMEEIEKAVKSGNSVSSVAKKYGLKWKETGSFAIGDSAVPELGDADEVVAEALRLKPGEVASKLIRSGGKAHIVKLKSLQTPQKVAANNTPETFSAAAMESLNRWAKELRDGARVKLNQTIINM